MLFLCCLQCSYLASDLFQIAILFQGTGDLDLGLLQKDGNGSHLNVLGWSHLGDVRGIKPIRSVKTESASWMSKTRL